MMICPETFYEMSLKGKSKEEIMTVIRSLKRKITRLKNEIADLEKTLARKKAYLKKIEK